MHFKNSAGHFVEEQDKNKEFKRWALKTIMEVIVGKKLLSIRGMDELLRVRYKSKAHITLFKSVTMLCGTDNIL